MTRKPPSEAEKNHDREKTRAQDTGDTAPVPGQDNDPRRGGYHHADTAMGTSHSDMIADFEHTITDQDTPDQGDHRRHTGERPRKKEE